jgi:hypothetical protein
LANSPAIGWPAAPAQPSQNWPPGWLLGHRPQTDWPSGCSSRTTTNTRCRGIRHRSKSHIRWGSAPSRCPTFLRPHSPRVSRQQPPPHPSALWTPPSRIPRQCAVCLTGSIVSRCGHCKAALAAAAFRRLVTLGHTRAHALGCACLRSTFAGRRRRPSAPRARPTGRNDFVRDSSCMASSYRAPPSIGASAPIPIGSRLPAANGRLNRLLAESHLLDEVCVFAPMGDDGLAVGVPLCWLRDRKAACASAAASTSSILAATTMGRPTPVCARIAVGAPADAVMKDSAAGGGGNDTASGRATCPRDGPAFWSPILRAIGRSQTPAARTLPSARSA